MKILAQGFASFEPEIIAHAAGMDEDEYSPAEDIKVCAGVCPLGHDCVTGCFDPNICSKW